jgi:S-adenosylmethionine hydrolase
VGGPVITFLTDYGLTDDFVGVCHGVIARVCPQARVIDLTHGVPRGDVRAGGLILQGALPYLPVGVHLAVVDPGVGSDRRAVALGTADGRALVGPDNGLLWLAAALASGVTLGETGEPLDPHGLVRLELPRPAVADGVLLAHAVYLDRFGNVQLDAERERLPGWGARPGDRVAVSLRGESWPGLYGRTFADVAAGELLVYEDAYQRLAVAVNQGSAVQRLGISIGDELRIAPA